MRTFKFTIVNTYLQLEWAAPFNGFSEANKHAEFLLESFGADSVTVEVAS